MLYLLLLVVNALSMKYCSCFLAQSAQGLNTTLYSGDSGYRELVSLIVDEKNSRHQLETYVGTLTERLNHLEQFRSETTKEILKNRNNRQQLIDENTKLSHELVKTNEELRSLTSAYDSLKQDFQNASKAYDGHEHKIADMDAIMKNITTNQDIIIRNTTQYDFRQQVISAKVSSLETEKLDIQQRQHHFNDTVKNINKELVLVNVSIDGVNELLKNNTKLIENLKVQIVNTTVFQQGQERVVNNLTEGQKILTNKYHTLLEQYLAINSHFQGQFVEKKEFLSQMHDLDDRILDLNDTLLQYIQLLKRQTGRYTKIGFSLRAVNGSTSAGHLKFDTVEFDTGKRFNMTTAEFVCNQSGMYFFIATIVRSPGINEAYCSIYVNRNGKQATVGQASTTAGYATGVAALVYHLRVGDRVFLGLCHGVDHMYFATSFSGFLIAPD